MFLKSKCNAAAAIIAISSSPAAAAILDIYGTATLTEISRSGFFETGFDPSDYSWISGEIDPIDFDTFNNSATGDTMTIHWELDTEAGSDWDQDPEDMSEINHHSYPGGPISATFTMNGTSWKVGRSEGSNVNYRDNPDEFMLRYGSGDNAGYHNVGDYPSGGVHETTINVRPEDYVTSKGLLNTFQYSGENLGTGYLWITSSFWAETNNSSDYKEMYSSLRLDYQITSMHVSLRGVTATPIAATPLPAGVFLIASGLFGLGLLRRRKASA